MGEYKVDRHKVPKFIGALVWTFGVSIILAPILLIFMVWAPEEWSTTLWKLFLTDLIVICLTHFLSYHEIYEEDEYGDSVVKEKYRKNG